MADSLLLRKGLLEGLADAPIIEGALSFTTDEPAIYIDVDGEHKRIGDIKEFADIDTLKAYLADNTGKIPTTGLYYAIKENALMKWTGSTWQQINEKSDFSGDINDLQSAVNAAQAAADKAQGEVDALEQTHATDKTALQADIDEVASDLADHLNAYTTKIAALEQADTKHTSDIASVNNAIAAEADRAKGVEADLEERLSTVETNIGEGTVDSRIATAKTAAIAAAKTETETQVAAEKARAEAAEKANANAISSLENLVGDETVDSRIATAKTAAIAAAKTETTSQVSAEKTRAEGQEAAIRSEFAEADSALDTRIKALETNKGDVSSSLNTITEDISALEEEAVNIRADFAAADTTTLNSAKTYAEEQATAVRGETTETVASVNTKVVNLTSTVSSNYNTLVSKIDGEATARENADAQIRTDFAAADTTLKTEITSEYKTYVDGKLQAADAMKFKGVVNAAADLPTTGVEAGWTYKVGTNFTLNGVNVYVGDLLIAEDDQGSDVASYPASGWAHVASGYEDDHDVHVELKDGKITVVNAAGQSRGSIEYASVENTSLSVATTEVSKDAQSGITDVKVTLSLEWGSF